MNEVNRTLFIPLYGKASVSRKNVILKDPDAERIWAAESFPVQGRSASKWLAFNMAMRACVFDDWTDRMLEELPDALVLHVGCGLDSRCRRVTHPYRLWLDCDLPDVIAARRKYFAETDRYRMQELDACDPDQARALPDSVAAVVVMEGVSMYLPEEKLRGFFTALQEKYKTLRILMDVYTGFGAKASKYKNPVNDVGVTQLYGIDDPGGVTEGMNIRFVQEHSFTPESLVNELKPVERAVFRLLFTGRAYGKIYRLLEFALD
ncbi:MAG: class I SAM-dependent methyltransferase [Firmicutes bacterium]|nr:class I SAM-dependent methyltransferase [Bacillota bacterium]